MRSCSLTGTLMTVWKPSRAQCPSRDAGPSGRIGITRVVAPPWG